MKKNHFIKIVFVVLALFFNAHLSFAKKCIETRAGLDIGTGTTKLVVADVDLCKKKLLKVLIDERKSIPFGEDLDKSLDYKLSNEIYEKAQSLIADLVSPQRAHPYKVSHYSAVATAVFRNALNGKAFVQKLSSKLKIPIKIISQEEEAHLGFLSVLLVAGVADNESVISWDIGGGSMQMYALQKNKSQIYNGQLASVSFKNFVLEAVQGKDHQKISSPNPLGEGSEKAVGLARYYAKVHVPKFFKENMKKLRVIGAGGVLGSSIQAQLDFSGKEFSLMQLEKLYNEKKNLKDEELSGEYKETDITNIALVLGFMKELGIEKVETVKSTLAYGVLIQ